MLQAVTTVSILEAHDGLQPIARAPRDGRVIRIVWGGRAFRARWDADAGFWRETGPGSRFWDDWELREGWAPLLQRAQPVSSAGGR